MIRSVKEKLTIYELGPDLRYYTMTIVDVELWTHYGGKGNKIKEKVGMGEGGKPDRMSLYYKNQGWR